MLTLWRTIDNRTSFWWCCGWRSQGTSCVASSYLWQIFLCCSSEYVSFGCFVICLNESVIPILITLPLQIFSAAFDKGLSPFEFLEDMRKKKELIPGIGHRVKSLSNPDMRVQILKVTALTLWNVLFWWRDARRNMRWSTSRRPTCSTLPWRSRSSQPRRSPT